MRVRHATSGDEGRLVELAAEFAAIDGHSFDAARVGHALQPLLGDDGPGFVLVLDDDGDLVGYAVVTWGWSLESGGRDALLDELYVVDQGLGHGAILLEALMEEAAADGARRVFLETDADNHAARRFYARHGFGVEDSVWMSRSLP